MYLMACTSLRVPQGGVRYGHAPQWHASHRRVHHGRASQDAAVLVVRTYLRLFDGRWPGVAFLILTLRWPWASCHSGQPQALDFVELGLRDRDVEKDDAEKALFPVQCPPEFYTRHFTGCEKEIDSI